MFNFIKQFFKLYNSPKNTNNNDCFDSFIFKELNKNLAYFKNAFNLSADLTIRELKIASTSAAVITIEGMVNKQALATSVINPIRYGTFFKENFCNFSSKKKLYYLKDNLLSSSEQVIISSFNKAFELSMSGFAIILIDGCELALAIGLQGFSFRNISEPTSDVMQTGSKEGFVESVRINMTLIRRRMKNPKLKFEMMSVGTVSKTNICLCYLTDVVSYKILNQLRQRINKSDLKTFFAAGYMIPYLEEKRDFSLFSSIGTSERPDTICAKIAEGRIGILIDGIPNALIAPYLFIEYFQTLDDYSQRPYFATITRWLKYLAFFVSTLLPGLYVSLVTFNPELFSGELLNKIANAVSTTPFPLMIETLVIHFIYEIMREAGLRLPRPLGHAVSIVGALVIGETAVSAGLIGSPTLMVVAITAISSYVIPSLYEPIAILRLIFIIVGGLTGVWGITLLALAILINICSKSNFGVPFSAPVSPFSLFSMRDVFVRAGWRILSKKENTIQDMPGTNINDGNFNK